jgi:hypothetical protein
MQYRINEKENQQRVIQLKKLTMPNFSENEISYECFKGLGG